MWYCCLDEGSVFLGRDFSKSCILLAWNNPTRCYEVIPSNTSSQSVSVDEALNLGCQRSSMCSLDAGKALICLCFKFSTRFSTVLPLTQPTASIPQATAFWLHLSTGQISPKPSVHLLLQKCHQAKEVMGTGGQSGQENSQLWSHLLLSQVGFTYWLKAG